MPDCLFVRVYVIHVMCDTQGYLFRVLSTGGGGGGQGGSFPPKPLVKLSSISVWGPECT